MGLLVAILCMKLTKSNAVNYLVKKEVVQFIGSKVPIIVLLQWFFLEIPLFSMKLMLTKKYNILGLVRSIMLNFFLVMSVWFCLILDVLMLLQKKWGNMFHTQIQLWPGLAIEYISFLTPPYLSLIVGKRLKNMPLTLNAAILLLFDLSCSLSLFSFLSNNKLSGPQHLVPVLTHPRILSCPSQLILLLEGNYKPTWISISSAEEEWDYIVYRQI